MEFAKKKVLLSGSIYSCKELFFKSKVHEVECSIVIDKFAFIKEFKSRDV